MSESRGVNDIHVGIGQVKTAASPTVLKAVLGSCVGIAFLAPTLGTYALAHCLLPHASSITDQINGRFVDQAIPSLFTILGLSKFDAPLIEAVVAGGASMYGDGGNKILRIGEMNVQSAMVTLEKYKVRIIHTDLGQFHGRQLIVDCKDGSYHVRNLSQKVTKEA
jgi:chemotaxis protein CheD